MIAGGGLTMQTPWSGRYTIGQVMVGIAVLASLLAVPRLVMSPDLVVMVCLVGLLTVLFVIHMLVEMTSAAPVPRVASGRSDAWLRHRHFYRCTACRGRFKRFGFGPWLDASGPEEAARFQRADRGRDLEELHRAQGSLGNHQRRAPSEQAGKGSDRRGETHAPPLQPAPARRGGQAQGPPGAFPVARAEGVSESRTNFSQVS